MKRRMWTAAVAVGLVLGCMVTGAYAQGPKEGHAWGGPGHEGHGMFMLHELNLTDAQQQQVKQIMQASHANMKPLMLQMEQNHLAMLQATANGAYDAAKIQALANQQAQLQAAMTVQHQALQHQIYAQVLTSEQQAKANQLIADQITHVTGHIQKIQSGTETAPPQE